MPNQCGKRLTSALSAADLSTETSLDGGDRTARSARVAGDEVQTVLSLVELGVGAAAGLAGDVFDWNMLDKKERRGLEDTHQYTDAGRTRYPSVGNDP